MASSPTYTKASIARQAIIDCIQDEDNCAGVCGRRYTNKGVPLHCEGHYEFSGSCDGHEIEGFAGTDACGHLKFGSKRSTEEALGSRHPQYCQSCEALILASNSLP